MTCHSPSKILAFKSPVQRKKRLEEEDQRNRFVNIEKEEEDSLLGAFKEHRKISKSPYKILDAPSLTGDFYLELINWSARNQLAVALGNAVWLWSGDSGKVSRFCLKKQADIEYTATQWDPKGDILTVGDSEGIVELWDYESAKVIFQCRNNIDRIDCVSWNTSSTCSSIFSTGSRDGTILTYDLRAGCKPIIKFLGHNDEVCGLKWSPNGNTLASGGNDNKVYLWNLKKQEAEARIDSHKAAVKALAWSPHQQNLLLTGGGSSDKTIKIWNTLSMTMISEIQTESQVCNLLFSKNSNEFLSTHGLYDNQIIVWKYPTLEKICVIERPNSHADRVLYLSESPNGENIVTGSSDETLKFWNIFPAKETKKQSSLLPSMKDLR
jgi:cell division cycle 20-like protein 1 (cofactor of APC complex)